MFVRYAPEGGQEQSWEFDPHQVRAAEAEVIEKRYGKGYEEWVNGVRSGEVKARRVLLWHLLRRQHHTLRFEDTPDFLLSELVCEHSVAELWTIKERMDKANLDPDQREQVLVALDIEISEAMAREQARSAPAGAPLPETLEPGGMEAPKAG